MPWEFLYDPRPAEFVALSRHTPIVRYLELPLGEPDLAVKPPIRILGLVANPTGVPALDIEREKTRVEQALQPLGDKVELVWLPGQTVHDLQTALQGGPWHVFHFVGHAAADGGSGEGVLLLADEQGNPDPLSATQLGRLLADQRTLRLAVLNACQGARGQRARALLQPGSQPGAPWPAGCAGYAVRHQRPRHGRVHRQLLRRAGC